MDQLFLRSGEEVVFVSLPEALKKGWKIEKERYEFKDTPARAVLRFQMLRMKDQSLLRAKERIEAATTDEERQGILTTLDFSKIGNHDFCKLLFALGPDALSLMIADILSRAASVGEVEIIAALCGLRHLMLESLIESDF